MSGVSAVVNGITRISCSTFAKKCPFLSKCSFSKQNMNGTSEKVFWCVSSIIFTVKAA